MSVAMIAMTTINSTSVKAFFVGFRMLASSSVVKQPESRLCRDRPVLTCPPC